jgi:hypothetical protein
MTQEHPITPPPELVRQWLTEECERGLTADHVPTQAARWGADQELEACRMEIIDGAGRFYIDETSDRVRLAEDIWTARRPKAPSLKEQALAVLTQYMTGETILTKDSVDTIRRALEQLPE